MKPKTHKKKTAEGTTCEPGPIGNVGFLDEISTGEEHKLVAKKVKLENVSVLLGLGIKSLVHVKRILQHAQPVSKHHKESGLKQS